MSRDGVPETGRYRIDEERTGNQPVDEGRLERRLCRLQCREKAVRQQAGAPGTVDGDRQAIDPEVGVSGCGPAGEKHHPADDVEL